MVKKHSPHLELAHSYWQNIVKIGDICMDATCGNGFDTLFLANCCLSNDNGKIYGFDIQQKAIDATKDLLCANLNKQQLQRVKLHLASHESFDLLDEARIKLVVYNLGYLPKGDKTITTTVNTTIKSLKSALSLVKNGAISIMCYPHREGKKEEEAILKWAKELPSNQYTVSFHQWINKISSPSFIWITSQALQKNLTST